MSWSNIPTDDLPVMDRRRWLIDIICTNVVVAILFVALRLFSRRLMRQKIWWDDYFIIFALVGYMANIVLTGVLLSMGLGRHLAQVPPTLLPTSNKLHLAGQLLYQWSMMAAKTSILLMYYRIFKVMPYFRAAASLVFVLVLLTALVFSFVYPFLCDPLAKLFDPSLPGACLSTKVAGIANGSINILTDILTLCLPFPQVWALPLKTMEKVTVSIAFALGLFVVFASSYRIHVIQEIDPMDTTYGLVPIYGWSLIDCFAAILSACLPVMKPVLLFLLDKLHLRGAAHSLLSRCCSRLGTMNNNKNKNNKNNNKNNNNNKNSRSGGEGGAGGEEEGTTTIADDGGVIWLGQDVTRVASSSSGAVRKSSFPRRASQASHCLDYTEARKHWSTSDTLWGDLREGLDDDDDAHNSEDGAVHFQTLCVLKSDS